MLNQKRSLFKIEGKSSVYVNHGAFLVIKFALSISHDKLDSIKVNVNVKLERKKKVN